MLEEKVRADVAFYVWTGVVLYVLFTALFVIDFYQRFGWDVWGYVGFFLFFGFQLFLLGKIRALRNWARNLFIVKFVLFALVFYPQAVILESGSWMYSGHFPHGALQHMSNLGNFLYELLFTLYLFKRNVRLAFVRS